MQQNRRKAVNESQLSQVMLCCRAIVDDVRNDAMPQQPVLWIPDNNVLDSRHLSTIHTIYPDASVSDAFLLSSLLSFPLAQ